MENATKALMIAASVIIAVMLLALAIGYWNNMSGYYSEQHDSKTLKQLIEFNNKFANYENKTIRGNELVSIMNRIIDYNNLQADIEGYDRIEIEINLLGLDDQLRDENANWNGSSSIRVNSGGYITNKTNDDDIKAIAELSADLLTQAKMDLPWITETRLQKLSANISWIAYDDFSTVPAAQKSETEKDYIANRLLKLQEILPGVSKDEIENNINAIKRVTCLYNEFTQFKRATFKCNEVLYLKEGETSADLENGRVKRMLFEVVTEDVNGETKIKFD